MEFWPTVAWFLLGILTVLRVGLVVGLIAIFWYVIKGVRKRIVV